MSGRVHTHYLEGKHHMTIAHRRLPFLATTALTAMAGVAILGLSPAAALAADECGAVGAETVICLPGTYSSGITYNGADVPLAMQDAVVVTEGGVEITATGSITIGISNAAFGTGDLRFANTTGAGLSAVADGSVFIDLNDADGGDAPASITGLSGVVAEGAGVFLDLANVAVTSTSTDASARGVSVTVDGANGVTLYANTVTAERTGVEASSVDGGLYLSSSDTITAGDDGFVGRATGTGAVWITAGAVSAGANGIVATTASGDVTVEARGPITAGSGYAILVNSGGSASVSLGANADLTSGDVSITHAGAFSFGNAGAFSSASGLASDLVIQQTGTSATLGNTGTLTGAVDFSAVTGALAATNNGTWRIGGSSEFTDGDDVFANNGQGLFSARGTTVVDFAGGDDSFASLGRIVGGAVAGASSLTFANLETFTNYGMVLFGSADGQVSDGETNDRIAADGADYTGVGAYSVFALDATVGASQADCAAAVAADCISFAGGSTAGATWLLVTDTETTVGSMGGALVLVDVAGGTSAADDFALDIRSTNYRDDLVAGPGLDKGLFFYRLDYDAAGRRHRLVAIPDREVFELAPLAAAAQSVWHTSVGSWTDRHTELRDVIADGQADGVGTWVKVTGALVDRQMATDFGGDNPGFITTYEQDTLAVVGGVDLLVGGSYVFGLTAGVLSSDVSFEASPTTARLEGMSYGAYASWMSDSLFVDAIVQGAKLDLEHATAWATAGDFGKGDLKSLGGQVEAGWRLAVNEGVAHVEPLASLSYVKTDLSDLALPNAAFSADEAVSLRGSVGVRLTGNADFDVLSLKGSLVGRLWNEFDGDNKAVVTSAGQSIALSDDFGGAFSEVTAGVSVYSRSGRVSAFVNTGVKFKDEYLASDTSAGLRIQW